MDHYINADKLLERVDVESRNILDKLRVTTDEQLWKVGRRVFFSYKHFYQMIKDAIDEEYPKEICPYLKCEKDCGSCPCYKYNEADKRMACDYGCDL